MEEQTDTYKEAREGAPGMEGEVFGGHHKAGRRVFRSTVVYSWPYICALIPDRMSGSNWRGLGRRYVMETGLSLRFFHFSGDLAGLGLQ